MTRYVKFESDGEEVIFTPDVDIDITEIAGHMSFESDHTVIENPFMPGAHTTSIHPKQRFIEPISIIVPKERRNFFLHFFRNDSTGRMTARLTDDVERFIEYIVYRPMPEQETICHNLRFNLSLRCAYPFWKDVYGFGQNLGAKIAKLHAGMPLIKYDPSTPRVAAFVKFDRRYAISNTGEIPIGIYLQIKTREYAENPKIILDDNDYIRVMTPLNVGDLLEISTVKEGGNLPETAKRIFVKLNGENIINKVDQRSRYFEISVGKHIISYDADVGAQTLEVYLYRNFAFGWV